MKHIIINGVWLLTMPEDDRAAHVRRIYELAADHGWEIHAEPGHV